MVTDKSSSDWTETASGVDGIFTSFGQYLTIYWSTVWFVTTSSGHSRFEGNLRIVQHLSIYSLHVDVLSKFEMDLTTFGEYH